ncbi:gamma-glutamyl-gamma-aminobutyrate hydrolase family protein [Arthrobacter sp. efr-133-TYG-120]|uniref:gamma-glutamyl-gamma-aminobutyrate hydrolase family protein n=1 Tax=Arthrobacter sp. efr-133-TYG-120 TaxID=3040280 RepID=UPI00254AC1BD|nr:gamma-glutamyl-gamma-aminobutyrate hydrolase family protein [Arthrobacter sp. efr-133-TYG-120]
MTSGHHQAVDDLGPGPRASAVAADAVVEAIETNEGDTWALPLRNDFLNLATYQIGRNHDGARHFRPPSDG